MKNKHLDNPPSASQIRDQYQTKFKATAFSFKTFATQESDQTFKEVSSIDTPDAHTAVFNLDNPAPYMLRALSSYESPMVPKHHLEGQDIKSAKLANNPVGTGPFKFIEWKKGQYIRLDKNDNYWKEGRPYLDRIVGRFVPDASTRAAAMEKGEVLYAAYNAVSNVEAVRLNKEKDNISVTTDGYSMINPMALIEFNTK